MNKNGNLILSDYNNNRIQILNVEDGIFLKSFGSQGSSPDQLSDPAGMEIDNDNYLYVCDGDNMRIQVFDDNFAFYHSISCDFEPFDIVISDDGSLFVSGYDDSLHMF